MLPPPTISEGDEEGERGSSTILSGHSRRSSGSDGAGSGTGADSKAQGKAATAPDGPARHTRHSSRLAAQADHGQAAAQQDAEERGGTKRRKD